MAVCEANPTRSLEELLAVKCNYFASEHFMISCGCVGVDLSARKVMIIRDTAADGTIMVQLPKGRKDIGEDLLATALRETYEETGVRFTALPLPVATRATHYALNASACNDTKAAPEALTEMPDVTRDVLNCEPAAVCTYPCIYTGALKMVFWFAAQGDSTEKPALDTREPWEENLSAHWVDAAEAAAMMTFEMDSQVINKVLDDVRKAGYEI